MALSLFHWVSLVRVVNVTILEKVVKDSRYAHRNTCQYCIRNMSCHADILLATRMDVFQRTVVLSVGSLNSGGANRERITALGRNFNSNQKTISI